MRTQLSFDETTDSRKDLVSTTREFHYEKRDEQPAYLIAFQDIERVDACGLDQDTADPHVG
jgi:hypothetical protein